VAELKRLGPETTGISFTSVLLQSKVTSRTARNGSEFLVVELLDVTGSISVNCFNNTPVFHFFKSSTDGQIVAIEGQTDYYQDKLSPRLQTARALTATEIEAGDWLNKLVPASIESPDLLWAELLEHIQSIAHQNLRLTVERIMAEIKTAFYETPGAISMHHAYRHGLLEHTVHIARVAKALFPIYPEVDPDLALTGVLLHDIGKTLEYIQDRVTKKSQLGILQGHVVLGYRMVRKAAIQSGLEEDLLERLEHIILSHQGELEWGAAVMAATPEAIFVSLIDNLDAKMGMVQQALRQNSEGFSPFFPGLKSSVLTTRLTKADPIDEKALSGQEENSVLSPTDNVTE
jgi:3'-5' exoribonuclease